jgi:group I intron endonuclease
MSYKINYSVYKIKNKITNQYYIGVDSYYPKRLKQHQTSLRNNKHRNKHLQSSYNKYGNENFSFKLLESCISREIMLIKEIEYIKYFKSLKNGFNYTIGGEGSIGYKHSKESLFKMSSWKRTITDEWRNNISKATKGIKKKKGIKRINHPNYNKWLGGEKHPVSKLTFKEICEIRLKYLNKEKQILLAKDYNVSKIMINAIITHRNWNDNNYIYIKKRNFNSEQYNKLKKYLNETLQTHT